MPPQRPSSPASSSGEKAPSVIPQSVKAAYIDQDREDEDDASSLASSSTCSDSSSASAGEPPDLDEQFLPRILALFFTIFHPTEGPKVVYQVPEGSVTSYEVGDKRAKGRRASSTKGKHRQRQDDEENGEPSWSPLLQQEPLFDFDTLSDYLIPKASLCGRLITCTARGSNTEGRSAEQRPGSRSGNDNGKGRSRSRSRRSPSRLNRAAALGSERHYKVVSHPVLLQDSTKYARNTFIFNLAFVFDGKADVKSYEPVIRKCARTLKGLEESSSFLSSQKSQPRMYGVVEQLFQGLNTYCEAFVPLPEGHQVNYDRRSGHRPSGSQSQSIAHPRSLSNSKSLSRRGSIKRQVEAFRGLSTAVEESFDKFLPNVCKSSDSTGPVISGDALAMTSTTDGLVFERNSASTEAPQTELSLQMSSMSPSFKSVGEKQLASSASSGVLTSPLQPRAPDSLENDILSSRRSSASTTASLTPSTIGSEAKRPQIPGTMVMSTIAVNEASAKAVISRKALGGEETAGVVTSSSRPNDQSDREGLLSDETTTLTASAADLSSSLASLRVIQEAASGPTAVQDVVGSLVTKPAAVRPGQREPPHGLGRTVKDSINIKLFPTWPNPPPVNDWDVPVSLLDLGRRAGGDSSNWDLTMARVYPHVNGINHVKRISQLADADLELTRQCMEHLLYYGCVVMVDIFQFFNIYTVRPAIAAMADYPAIQAECGPYVTRPGYVLPAWPTLLSLYTALRPGVLLDAWIEDRDVEALGIDVRRFVTFGIIKGFLKRVHRYPYLIGGPDSLIEATRAICGENPTMSGMTLRDTSWQRRSASEQREGRSRELVSRQQGSLKTLNRGDVPGNSAMPASQSTLRATAPFSSTLYTPERPLPSPRQASDVGSTRTVTGRTTDSTFVPDKQQQQPSATYTKKANKPTQTNVRHPVTTVADAANAAFEDVEDTRRPSSTMRPSKSILLPSVSNNGSGSVGGEHSAAHTVTPSAAHYADSPMAARTGRRTSQYFSSSAQATHDGGGGGPAILMSIPPELPGYLDGTHCEDELCVKFGLSWPQLRRILVQIGKVSSAMSGSLGGVGGAGVGPGPVVSSSVVAGRRASTQQDDWPMEMPAFGNPSGFASQSGFGASAWQTSHLGGMTNAGGGGGTKLRRPSWPSGFGGGSETTLGGRRSSGGGSGGGRVGSQTNLRSVYRTSAEAGGRGYPSYEGSGYAFGASTGGVTAANWTQQMDHLEIEAEEDEMERRGDLGGVVLLTI